MKSYENIKVGISGIRGVVGDTLTPENVINFTRAFSTLIRKGTVAVATDSRPSGELVKNAVLSGLVYSRITPLDAGTLPTPTLQVFVKEKGLNGGIIVTASHNPEQWNGLKFVDERGFFLSPYRALHLIDLYHQGGFIVPEENAFPGVTKTHDAFRLHRDKILRIVDRDKIRECRFKVLVDPGGGAGTRFDKELLEALGCDVDVIHGETSPTFPRNPEPLPENLEEASRIIRSGDYDIGFAQDADADRLALLDERGVPLEGDYTLAIALMGFLRGAEPGKVVFNLSTSRIPAHVARECGFGVEWVPVGEINVVEAMIEGRAIAGGEGNGGVIVPTVHPCRDSFTAMALVLETLAHTGKTVSEIVRELPAYKMIKLKLGLPMTDARRIVRRLIEENPAANTADGLKVEKENYWYHIRPSNTEPVLRIVVEGKEGEVETIAEDLKERVLDLCESGRSGK
jgi:phosphomannomutase